MKHLAPPLAFLLPLATFLACSEGEGEPEYGQTGDGDGDAPGGDGGDGDGDTATGGTEGGDGDTATGGTEGGDGDLAGTGGFVPAFPEDVTTPTIRIVGDSISAGPGCYKKYLLQNLEAGGHTNFEFVGEYTDDCGGGVMHSAVSCTTSADYTKESFTTPGCEPSDFEYPGMATLMASHDPDMVMLQLGVNDVWGGVGSIEPILDNYSTLVAQARAQNPNIVIFVAQIHQIITDNCMNTASTTKAKELVDAVPAWAAGETTEESPVLVADLWTNSDPMEPNDCVHPGDTGARQMADDWYEAIKDIIP